MTKGDPSRGRGCSGKCPAPLSARSAARDGCRGAAAAGAPGSPARPGWLRRGHRSHRCCARCRRRTGTHRDTDPRRSRSSSCHPTRTGGSWRGSRTRRPWVRRWPPEVAGPGRVSVAVPERRAPAAPSGPGRASAGVLAPNCGVRRSGPAVLRARRPLVRMPHVRTPHVRMPPARPRLLGRRIRCRLFGTGQRRFGVALERRGLDRVEPGCLELGVEGVELGRDTHTVRVGGVLQLVEAQQRLLRVHGGPAGQGRLPGERLGLFDAERRPEQIGLPAVDVGLDGELPKCPPGRSELLGQGASRVRRDGSPRRPPRCDGVPARPPRPRRRDAARSHVRARCAPR